MDAIIHIIATGTIETGPNSVVNNDIAIIIKTGPSHIQCCGTVPPKINIGSTLINVTILPLDCDNLDADDNLIAFRYTKFITAALIRNEKRNIQ